MIDNLIIIIPTHNRQHYLRRVVKYYSSFPCKVYICDSSKQKAEIECSDNITYRWVPQSNFYGKVLDVLNETSADFYALSPDDDFLKEETLVECYEALLNNEKYSAGMGRQVLFKESFDGNFIAPAHANLLKDIGSVKFDSKSEYANYFETHYQNILWSLFRCDTIKKAFLCLSQCGFSNGNFVELILGIESLKRGEIYLSENGLNFREISLSDHWGSVTLPITKQSIDNDEQLRNDIEKFYAYYEGDQFVKFCFESYLNADFHSSSPDSIKSIVLRLIPRRIKDVIKSFIPKKDFWGAAPAYIDYKMSYLIKDVL